MALLVADFSNKTGDPIFDGTLEPTLNFALEGAGFITTYNRSQARKLAGQLEHASGTLTEPAARLIALREGINVVVSGSLVRRDGKYEISAKAEDPVSGKLIASGSAKASGKDQILTALPRLAVPIRKALGDSTPESAQVAKGETFTAGSIEAAHEYAIAQELAFAGKLEDAIREFTKVVALDPTLGRAYVGMGIAHFNMHQRQDAEKASQLAMAHVDRMSDRERLRTRGAYFLMTGDQQRCVEEFTVLVGQFPSDTAGHTNLAICYSNLRNFPKALEEARRAAEVYPKHPILRNNAALISAYAGDFQSAERDARTAQQLNPNYVKAYMALAFAQLGQAQTPQAAETYRNLERLGPSGAAYAALGLADLAIYEGRFKDAEDILEKSTGADVLQDQKWMALANVRMLRGDRAAAVQAIEHALSSTKEVSLRFLAARMLVELGQDSKARAIAAELGARMETEPHAYAKLIEGDALTKTGKARQAITSITEASKLLDTWIGRFDLGRTYLEAGALTQADSEFDRCIRRRGEAMTLFFDEIPTYGYFPPVYYYLGRVRQALGSPGFADSYRTYTGIRGGAAEDPLLRSIRELAAK